MTTLEIPFGYDDPARDAYLAWCECVKEHASWDAFNLCPEMRLRRYAKLGLTALEAASLIGADNEDALTRLILERLKVAREQLAVIEELIQLG